jgi:hypothetical protein
MIMRRLNWITGALVCACFAGHGLAQVPRTISYQGVMTDSAGTPRPDGTYSFTFSLYQSNNGGSPLWSEQKTLQLVRGLFSTALGDQVIIPDSLTFDRQYWLGIKVANDPEMSPRVRFTSSGYSFRSIRADTAQFAKNVSQGVTGSGTPGYVPKWSGNGSRLENSLIQDFGTSMSIGAFAPGGGLSVSGDLGPGPSQYYNQFGLSTPSSDGHLIRLSFAEGPDAKAQIESARQSSASDGYLAFRVRTAPGGLSELMRLHPNGNVGVGSTNPQARLEVNVPFEEARALRLSSGPNAFLDIYPSGSTSTVFTTVNSRNVVFHMGSGKFRLEKGAGGVASPTTDTGFLMENNDTSGNSGWFYNASQTNKDAVIKLHKHPSSTADFIDGWDWDGSSTIVRKFHISSTGTYVGGSDFAEAFRAKDGKRNYEPGDVVVLCEDGSKEVEKSTSPYDTKVAGIYSTRPGVLGADKDGDTRMDADDIPVAIVGIVPTKVTDENGAIHAGDLLTTSSAPGRAMKAAPVSVNGVKIYPTGTILGKALEPLNGSEGIIKVLVTIR